MTLGSRDESGPSTRDAIIAAALTRFERDGVSRTSMDDVAAAAGVSRKSVYYHFAKKRLLVEEILIRRAQELQDVMRAEIVFKEATFELIVTALARGIELTRQDTLTGHLVDTGEGQALHREFMQERILVIRRSFWIPLLEAAQANNEIRSDLDLDETLTWLMFLSLSLVSIGADYGYSGVRLRAALEDFLVRGLAGPKSTAVRT